MAIQRAGVPAVPSAGLAPVMPAVSAGPALSTRESPDKPFIELGVMFGQAMGGREPVMQALTNLQNIGQTNGCDAVIAVKLLHYPTAAGPAVVAYGTGIRFLPQASSQDGALGASDGRAGGPTGDGAAGAAPAPATGAGGAVDGTA